ncbi:sortase A [Catenulispora sp. EB89]|uniref:sortase n=1 Tax=Catenulispora sp. EB89 TaxID=3156257 RepID=UPI0035151476
MTRQNADDFEDGSEDDASDGELGTDTDIDTDISTDTEGDTEGDSDSELDADEPEAARARGVRNRLVSALVVLVPVVGLALLLARWIRPLIPGWLTKPFLLRVCGVAICTLGVALSTFVAEVAVFGRFEHRHDQQVEYAAFRAELAAGTAPIGARDYRDVLLGPGAPVALLSIPSIRVDEVVAEGTSAAVLESGPGLLRGTVLPGQVGTSMILARAFGYGGPFHYLDQVQPGDRVEVTTGQGVAEYRVSDTRHGGDPEPARLHGQLGRLTLITASGAAYTPDDALYVDADLISQVQPTPLGAVPRFAGDEAPMAQDRYARLDVAGWTAVLVAATVLAFWAGPRWGRSKTWLVAVPVLLVVGLTLADRIALLLPNLT